MGVEEDATAADRFEAEEAAPVALLEALVL